MGLYGNFFTESGLITLANSNEAVVEEKFDILSFLNSPVLDAFVETSSLLESSGTDKLLQEKYNILMEFSFKDLKDRIVKVIDAIWQKVKNLVKWLKDKFTKKLVYLVDKEVKSFEKKLRMSIKPDGTSKYDSQIKYLTNQTDFYFRLDKCDYDRTAKDIEKGVEEWLALLRSNDMFNSLADAGDKEYDEIFDDDKNEKLKYNSTVELSAATEKKCEKERDNFVKDLIKDDKIDYTKYLLRVNNEIACLKKDYDIAFDCLTTCDKQIERLRGIVTKALDQQATNIISSGNGQGDLASAKNVQIYRKRIAFIIRYVDIQKSYSTYAINRLQSKLSILGSAVGQHIDLSKD